MPTPRPHPLPSLLLYLSIHTCTSTSSPISPPTPLRTYRNGMPDGYRLAAPTGPVASWHWPMVHDWERNDKYNDAITRAIASFTTNVTVVDVGAGIGLLAVMAANAGAARVVALEHQPAIAALATKVAAANGYAETISVVVGDALDIVDGFGDDRDMDPVVVVHELFASAMLCEYCHSVIPVVRDAVKASRVIPARARSYAVLVDSRYLAGDGDPATRDQHASSAFNVSGVDISAAQWDMSREHRDNAGIARGEYTTTSQGDLSYLIGTLALPLDDLVRVSEPVLLNSVDFETGAQHEVMQWAAREGETAAFTVTKGGTARAVVVYWEADMDEDSVLSTDPFGDAGPPSRARLQVRAKRIIVLLYSGCYSV